MNITYRDFNSDDIEGIIRFWNENSGWETNLDVNEFNLRFCSSPCGMPIIMLAVNEDEQSIVGLCCFLPAYVNLKGEDVVCYRPFGAIIKESFRQCFGISSLLTGKHPILKLYHVGSEIAKQKKASLIFLIPDPRWSKLAKVMSFETKRFPLLSYNLRQDHIPSKEPLYDVRDMNSTDPDIDKLWNQSSRASICTLTKNRQFYHWKINFRHGLYKLKGVYDNNKLIGLFTLHFKECQWVIGDLLPLDDNYGLTLTLRAACDTAQVEYFKKSPDRDKVYKVAILATQVIEDKAKALGFYRDNYNFTLAVQLLDKENFSKADVAPDRWYISATD